MPGSHHLKGNVSSKEQRQYEHVKQSEEASGKATKVSKAIAAATVNKERKKRGETKSK